jgi:hypothetical protein
MRHFLLGSRQKILFGSLTLLVILALFRSRARNREEWKHDIVNDKSSKPVEPSLADLQKQSLCPSYSEEYNRYMWTSDEGRCIFEFFMAHFDDSAPRTVLEMGVMQGSSNISHSYTFQYSLGWKTILIEANPEMEKDIRTNRPGATIHMVPVCSKPATLNFLVTTGAGLNGFEELMDAHLFEMKLKKHDAKVVRKIPMQCQPMTMLLQGVPVIDAFFLDVEGAELSVLETIDFNRTCVQIFNIEDGGPNSAVGTLLQSKGFSHVGWNTEQWDHVWLNPVNCRL